jgi:hypothetical protein
MLWESPNLEPNPVFASGPLIEGIMVSGLHAGWGEALPGQPTNHETTGLRLFDDGYGNGDDAWTIPDSLLQLSDEETHGLRALTDEEWNLISGGGITVWGNPNAYWGWDHFGYWDTPPFWDPGPGDSSGGGGGEPPTDDYCPDMEAAQSAQEIAATALSSTTEFGSVIYRASDGRVLHSPPMTSGGSTSLDPAILLTWMQQNDVMPDQVLGFVHNHPDSTNTAGPNSDEQLNEQNDLVNRFPSADDWAVADQLVGGGFSNPELSLYIIDDMGVLREFKYSEAHLYRPPPPNASYAENYAWFIARANGQNLPTPVGRDCS